MADNLNTFKCRLSRNSRSLNLLEPEGPVQACNGIAVPFYKGLELTKLDQLKSYIKGNVSLSVSHDK